MEITMRRLAKFARLYFALMVLIIWSTPTSLTLAQSQELQIPYLDDWKESAHAEAWKESFLDRYTGPEVAKGTIPAECARCHSTPGFHDYIGLDGSAAGEMNSDAVPRNGIACVACHNKATMEIEEVTFPSGESVEMLTRDARCMMCHQGRNSTVSINEVLAAAGSADDAVSADLEYIDSHFLPAATRFGTEAKGGYEYPDLEYEGFYIHDEESSRCFDCHSLHTEKVEVSSCDSCHRKVTEPKHYKSVRKTKVDFDGDGDIKEGMAHEIRALQKELYKALFIYAKTVVGTPLAYDKKTYPYFFNDSNGNGKADEAETVPANKYQQWTPRLIKAAYNFQYIVNEPGAFVHNPFYSLQLLYDSLHDLSGKVPVNMEAMERP
jgi:hypothetical protein